MAFRVFYEMHARVPFLKSRISVDIIRFVYSKRRRLGAGNFAVILLFIPFTTYDKPSFTELAGWSLTDGFRARKVFGTFEKQAAGPSCSRAG